VAGCCSGDQQSESCSEWPAFISKFLSFWVRKSYAEVNAAKSCSKFERQQQNTAAQVWALSEHEDGS
jgi:hypothetical protein